LQGFQSSPQSERSIFLYIYTYIYILFFLALQGFQSSPQSERSICTAATMLNLIRALIEP